MLEASVWIILKDLGEGMPRHGRVLTYFFISWTTEVLTEDQAGGLLRSLSKKGLHCFLRSW